jgi:hypothetical protein
LLAGPEATAFVEKHPGSLTVERKLRETTIAILVAPTKD